MNAYLITGSTARFDHLGVVSLTVDATFLVAVHEIDQQLFTREADEACRVPACIISYQGSKDANLTCFYFPFTVVTILKYHAKMISHLISMYHR